MCFYSSHTLNTILFSYGLKDFSYSSSLYMCLLLLLSMDIEANPGPRCGMVGLCRTCGAESYDEKESHSVEYNLNRRENGLKRVFHNHELLKIDHPHNPKFICKNCARQIMRYDIPESPFKVAKLEIEKKPLPIFLQSESKTENSKKETSVEELKTSWSSAKLNVQCEFMVFIATDIKIELKRDFDTKIAEMKNEDDTFKSTCLEEMNLQKYLCDREKRLVSFFLGFTGRTVQGLGDQIPKVVTTIESVYSLSLSSLMPFRYAKQQQQQK